MARGREPLRSLLLILAGAIGGYLYALHGLPSVTNLPAPERYVDRVTHYARAHPPETLVGIVLVAIIGYLLLNRRAPSPKGRR